MTKRYKVTGIKVRFGPGFVLDLGNEQAAARSARLDKVKGGHYRVQEAVEFKRGEEIGVVKGDVPKSWQGFLEPAGDDVDIAAPENINGAVKAVHQGFGKWDVIDKSDQAVNDAPLKKQEAHALVDKLNADGLE